MNTVESWQKKLQACFRRSGSQSNPNSRTLTPLTARALVVQMKQPRTLVMSQPQYPPACFDLSMRKRSFEEGAGRSGWPGRGWVCQRSEGEDVEKKGKAKVP